MKKALFFTILLFLTVSAFAQDIQNRYLFIEGTADNAEHLDFFKTNFVMEAEGNGYIVTETRREAAHTLRFRVNYDPYFDENVINLSLLRNEDGFEIINFDYAFTQLEDMYQINRTLFLNATTNIPLPLLTEDIILAEGLKNKWKNKWIYFRASFDYPITFYILQSTDLQGGIGLYNTSPPRVSPISHEIMAMPGATLGIEFQLLNFLSIEPNFQLSFGDTRNNSFVNMAAGVELKFPIKFQNITLAPYGAFTYHLNVSSIFSDFPPFSAGAGIQVSTRAGKRGAFFADVKYMFSFSDAVMRNPYLDYPAERQLFPKPPVIHYKRSQIGIGVGYKIGILDRK